MYDPGILEFGRTYYWRIDEINAPPDSTVFKGDVWSFTVESFAYPISAENITVTASSYTEGQEPENTVNGSGLDVNDLHTNTTAAMWLTPAGEAGPAWIQYQFNKAYKLHQMLVWNYNGESFLVELGHKEVTIEYSADGTKWTQLDGTFEFPQATGENDYASDIIVDFDGTIARFVKINAVSNWLGWVPQYGLSEVRFLHVPVSAKTPVPADGATNVPVDVTLGWVAGREAAEHNVYFSTDEQSVIDGTVLVDTVIQTNYGPLSLGLDSTYYWRVDEVNNADIWQSDIWNFTTQEYIVVEDFESYNDIPEGQEGSNLVYFTWIDGGYGEFNDPTNGSTIGYLSVPSLDPNIFHSGRQSAPLMYDNSSASLSEVTVSPVDMAIGRDWTIGNPSRLVIWFYGDPNNATTEQMYVELNGVKVTYDGDAGDIAIPLWQPWNIDLAPLGINLINVTTFSIGFGRTGTTGGSGIVFIGDIRLHLPLPEAPEPEPFDGQWTYIFNGDAGVMGADNNFDSLDGTWDHSNGSDEWDGSVIGEARPGGVSVIDGYLRIQETGDPRDHDMSDPGSNRKVAFAHSITNDIGDSAAQILDGVTISFRARVATGAPLDDTHPDEGGNVTPWPAGGDGYVIHDSGKGNFSVCQSEDDMIISFALALALASDDDELPASGLVMNKLNGSSPTGDVDITGDDPGWLNILELAPTAWHDYWITIQPDVTANGTHLVKVYLDGSQVSNDFYVTAGNGNDYEDSYILMGMGATPQSGAIDVDYFSYKQGLFTPTP